MNKFAATSSGSIGDGFGAPPPLKLAGGVGRNETPPAFLIQRVGGFSLLTPLQVISVHAPNNRSNGPSFNSNR